MKHLIPIILIAAALLGCQSNSKPGSGDDTSSKLRKFP